MNGMPSPPSSRGRASPISPSWPDRDNVSAIGGETFTSPLCGVPSRSTSAARAETSLPMYSPAMPSTSRQLAAVSFGVAASSPSAKKGARRSQSMTRS